jgi:hypothetical protein
MSFEYSSPEFDAGEYAEPSWKADPDKYKELLKYIKLVSAMITYDSFSNLRHYEERMDESNGYVAESLGLSVKAFGNVWYYDKISEEWTHELAGLSSVTFTGIVDTTKLADSKSFPAELLVNPLCFKFSAQEYSRVDQYYIIPGEGTFMMFQEIKILPVDINGDFSEIIEMANDHQALIANGETRVANELFLNLIEHFEKITQESSPIRLHVDQCCRVEKIPKDDTTVTDFRFYEGDRRHIVVSSIKPILPETELYGIEDDTSEIYDYPFSEGMPYVEVVNDDDEVYWVPLDHIQGVSYI